MLNLLPWTPVVSTLVVVALVAWRTQVRPLVPVQIRAQPTPSNQIRSR
jgi:hypothetical protein